MLSESVSTLQVEGVRLVVMDGRRGGSGSRTVGEAATNCGAFRPESDLKITIGLTVHILIIQI